jgi:hypothetical protein
MKPDYVEIDPLQRSKMGVFHSLSAAPPQNLKIGFARSLGWHILKPIRVHLDQNRGSILPLA